MFYDGIISGLYTTQINLSPRPTGKRTKQKKEGRKRRSSYYHYFSPALLGGLRAAGGGTLDDRDFEARWVRVQKASMPSFARLALYPDPNNSNSDSSSGKCNKTTVSASRAPQ
jgi:hypothetical protein